MIVHELLAVSLQLFLVFAIERRKMKKKIEMLHVLLGFPQINKMQNLAFKMVTLLLAY